MKTDKFNSVAMCNVFKSLSYISTGGDGARGGDSQVSHVIFK